MALRSRGRFLKAIMHSQRTGPRPGSNMVFLGGRSPSMSSMGYSWASCLATRSDIIAGRIMSLGITG